MSNSSQMIEAMDGRRPAATEHSKSARERSSSVPVYVSLIVLSQIQIKKHSSIPSLVRLITSRGPAAHGHLKSNKYIYSAFGLPDRSVWNHPSLYREQCLVCIHHACCHSLVDPFVNSLKPIYRRHSSLRKVTHDLILDA